MNEDTTDEIDEANTTVSIDEILQRVLFIVEEGHLSYVTIYNGALKKKTKEQNVLSITVVSKTLRDVFSYSSAVMYVHLFIRLMPMKSVYGFSNRFIFHVGNTDEGAVASIQLNLAGEICVVSRQISL
ncbi:hypothetical protein V1478_014281 [Vespula squamosa]|uniref:Uncharacterized protein n=1 Tax=Vespula squamosa TaxID=30214 RepID=A0ABD2A9Z3_VESSQ